MSSIYDSRRASYILGRYFHPGLFLPRSGGPVHVHVRVGDGRPGVQQGAQCGGDGGLHHLQVGHGVMVNTSSNHVSMVPKFCGCRSSPQGDIISWDREAWTLRSPWNRSEAEMLDLERDVCDNREQGHFLVPHKHTFDEAVHVCRKLSGTLISYTDKAEFDDLIYFLSRASNQRASQCFFTETEKPYMTAWAGGSDRGNEGVWTSWNTKTDIKVCSLK